MWKWPDPDIAGTDDKLSKTLNTKLLGQTWVSQIPNTDIGDSKLLNIKIDIEIEIESNRIESNKKKAWSCVIVCVCVCV